MKTPQQILSDQEFQKESQKAAIQQEAEKHIDYSLKEFFNGDCGRVNDLFMLPFSEKRASLWNECGGVLSAYTENGWRIFRRNNDLLFLPTSHTPDQVNKTLKSMNSQRSDWTEYF